MGKESKKELYQLGSKRGYYLLRHTGVYDFKGVLSGLKDKLDELEYFIIDKEHTEALSAAGKETKFVWVCSREVAEYVKFDMELTIITLRQIDVLVDKKKLQRGDFEFRISAKVVKNHKDTFKDTKMGEIQRHLYEKVLIPTKLDDCEDRLVEEATDLIKIVKECMK